MSQPWQTKLLMMIINIGLLTLHPPISFLWGASEARRKSCDRTRPPLFSFPFWRLLAAIERMAGVSIVFDVATFLFSLVFQYFSTIFVVFRNFRNFTWFFVIFRKYPIFLFCIDIFCRWWVFTLWYRRNGRRKLLVGFWCNEKHNGWLIISNLLWQYHF